MTKFFVQVYEYLSVHTRLATLLPLALAGIFIALMLRLDYREDIADFLPDSKANERINAVYTHIGNSDKLMVYFAALDTVADDSKELIINAMDAFSASLADADSANILAGAMTKADDENVLETMNFIRANIPLFLSDADYSRMDLLLGAANYQAILETDKQILMLPSGTITRDEVVNDPLHLFTPVWQRLNTLRAGDGYEQRDGHLFTPAGQRGVIILTSPYGVSETSRNSELTAMINSVIQQTESEIAGVKITLFGGPVIAVTNASQIKSDSLLAVALSIALILLLLLFFFRKLRHILLIFASVAFGWLFALGMTAIFTNEISIIALGVSSVFIGIAVNYPLHFISHSRHSADAGNALKEIISPLLIGNITTVSAFLSLIFIRSSAMRDLGLFGSLLLVGAILFTLVFLPHYLKKNPMKSPEPASTFGFLSRFAPERNRWIVLSVVALTAIFLYLSRFTQFEPSMNAINYMTAEQRADMESLLRSVERRGSDIVYLVSEGADRNGALTAYERSLPTIDSLSQAGIITQVSGIGSWLASDGELRQRIARWNDFRNKNRDSIEKNLIAASRSAGFNEGAFSPFIRLLDNDFANFAGEIAENTPLSALTGNYLIGDGTKSMLITLLYCDNDNTSAVEKAFRTVGDSFTFDTRDVGQRMVDALSNDFNYVLYICGFIVFAFLAISFGRLELSILAFLPLAISWIWILGIMQMFDIRFNIVNIILATFIFGQGDDYTIFITDGLIYEYAYRRQVLRSHKNSIILSSLIMFAGIGTLIFAKHPALRSLAEVTIVGMFSVVLMAYIIPPLIFRWLTQKRGSYRKVPVTVRRLIYSAYSFAFFLFGSISITVIGFCLFAFGRKTERKRLIYHKILCGMSRFVIKRVPGVKFRFDNLAGETFDNPAVIISNHQSHLDLMCLLMLNPKIIIMTNDWVWNNIFYGILIRYADFYPASKGFENSLEVLSERVGKGYSIMIFPEGTRSENSSIGRFHRGAFYLAEQLKLDILPVFIHGAGDVLPKSDFMLRQGGITVQVHERITLTDSRFSSDYAVRTKQIRQYYRQTFNSICDEIETPDYFKPFVMHNFVYKGVKVHFGAAAEATRDLPVQEIDESTVIIRNSGYGVFAFMYALAHKNKRIITVEDDEDKAAVARNCAGLPENISVYSTQQYNLQQV
ncbi:MAG: 1-acyl-sn-glycerol-3-phosphate acyltransferase [Tannerella sp.]|jgi:1-acyl-sn-glycerol-3-phosphate acyltransferase|nr:1-acyl-sn-glycerol-3-phosphate acyltransferase [Tannerella sp.]